MAIPLLEKMKAQMKSERFLYQNINILPFSHSSEIPRRYFPVTWGFYFLLSYYDD